MLLDELRHILSGLLDEIGANGVAIGYPVALGADLAAGETDGATLDDITTALEFDADADADADADLLTDPMPDGVSSRTDPDLERPLGGGARLALWLPRTLGVVDDAIRRDAAIERAVRSLRACARRWDASVWPAIALPQAPRTSHERIRTRITAFLRALANVHGCAGVIVTVRGAPVARSGPLDAVYAAQVPFLLARVDAEVKKQRGDSSHTELYSDEMFVISFWYGACLVAFFDAPYSVDFFRHRAKLVIREVAKLLPSLDEPPPSSASYAPIPE